MAVNAMKIGPGQDFRGCFGILFRHAPAKENSLKLSAMIGIGSRHGWFPLQLALAANLARPGCSGKGSARRSAMRRETKMADSQALMRARFGIDLPETEIPDAIASLIDRRVTRRYT